MSALENDINRAIEILSYLSKKYNMMVNYSRIYQNNTENVKGYMKYFMGDGNSTLLPVASGGQLIEAILCGYNDISCFDINRLAKYYVKLKLTAISVLSEKDYIKFMYEDMFNNSMFNYLKRYLDDDTREFWSTLFSMFGRDRIISFLFRRLIATNNSHSGTDFSRYCADNYTSLFDDNNYKLLQDKLDDVSIDFIDSDITDLPNNLDKKYDFINLPNNLDKKYDFINLTNIYQYYNLDVFSGNDRVYCNIVNELIDNNLNNGGMILVSYLYRCCIDDLYRYMDKPLMYVRIMNFIKNTPSLKKIYDRYYNLNTITEKISFFRKFQLLR